MRHYRVILALLAAPVAAVAEPPAEPLLAEMAIVEEIRGMSFIEPVETATMTPDELRSFLETTIDEELGMNPRDYVTALRVLGVLEDQPNDPLDALLELYMSQVLAFYDPETERFYEIEGATSEIPLAGMERMVAIHELTHALQDQHLGLGDRIEAARDDWDRVTALQALVEGEATLVMLASAVNSMGFSLEEAIRNIDLAEMMRVSLAIGNLTDTPPYFVHSMVFPYAAGLDAVSSAWLRGGWSAVDALYEDETLTTSEIYHPGSQLEPGQLELEGVGDVLLDTRLGEFHWRFLLGEDTAAGWRNDRVLVSRLGETVQVQLVTEWSDAERAAEFSDALRSKLGELRFPAAIAAAEKSVAAVWQADSSGMAVEQAMDE